MGIHTEYDVTIGSSTSPVQPKSGFKLTLLKTSYRGIDIVITRPLSNSNAFFAKCELPDFNICRMRAYYSPDCATIELAAAFCAAFIDSIRPSLSEQISTETKE